MLIKVQKPEALGFHWGKGLLDSGGHLIAGCSSAHCQVLGRGPKGPRGASSGAANPEQQSAEPKTSWVGALDLRMILLLGNDQLRDMIESCACVIDLKRWLAARLGYTRFRQRILGEEASELQDDMPLMPLPSLQLVILQFCPKDEVMEQLLLRACQENGLIQVEKLLKKPLDPNVKATGGIAPIHVAAQNGHLEVAQLLLEARAEVEAATAEDGSNAVHFAAMHGQVDMLKFLLEAGASRDAPMRDGFGATALHIGAQNGELEVVQFLLEAKAQKNTTTTGGATALHFAAQNGHAHVVQFLAEAGVEKDAVAYPGTAIRVSPAELAVQHGHQEVARVLVEAGAGADGAVTAAVVTGNADILLMLLERRAEVNRPSEQGRTPLHVAAEGGDLEIVKILLERGANKNVATTDEGMTALSCAARFGRLEVVKCLVEAGADKDAMTPEGKTAFVVAIENRRLEVAMFLANSGAKVDEAIAASSPDPLHHAAEAGHVEVVDRLLEKKAPCDRALTSLSITPLHLAAQNGHLKVVQALLEAGADENAALADGHLLHCGASASPAAKAGRFRGSDEPSSALRDSEKGAAAG
eukprot:s1639_g6.t1